MCQKLQKQLPISVESIPFSLLFLVYSNIEKISKCLVCGNISIIETSFKEIASLICKNVWGNDHDFPKKIAITVWTGATMTTFAKLIKETVDKYKFINI